MANEIYTIGCLDKGFEFFRNNMMLIAGMAVAFTLPLLIGIFMIHVFVAQILSQLVKVEKEKIYLWAVSMFTCHKFKLHILAVWKFLQTISTKLYTSYLDYLFFHLSIMYSLES